MTAKLDLKPEAIAAYRETARRREQDERRERTRRRGRAWEVARQAAELLRSSFGASQVIAFGSLVHGHWFSTTSDVDLAAWGLKDEDYFLALARLQDLAKEFKVDLVRGEACGTEFKDTILREGQPL
jgi:predicted nucleotidyltransferase